MSTIVPFPRSQPETNAAIGANIQNISIEIGATLCEGHARIVASSAKAAYSREEVAQMLQAVAGLIRRHKDGGAPEMGGAA